MTTARELNTAAERVAQALTMRNLRIVFAESCTGGLISAAMTGVPGVSAYHCGSAVVYRIETKAEWLGIPRPLLDKPGPVSREVAAAMARTVLEKTPEADVSAAVTGHLGPDAPRRQDGLIYIGIARRDPQRTADNIAAMIRRFRLEPATATTSASLTTLRRKRQRDAAVLVLRTVYETVESLTTRTP